MFPLPLPIPKKVRLLTVNPKQTEVSSLNGKVDYLCVTHYLCVKVIHV